MRNRDPFKKGLMGMCLSLSLLVPAGPTYALLGLGKKDEKKVVESLRPEGHDMNKSIGTAAGRFIDLIINDSGVSEALLRSGVHGDAAGQVRRYVGNSLEALMVSGGKPNRQQLGRRLQQISLMAKKNRDRGDQKVIANLVKTLNKKESELKKGDFVEAVNQLIYLANRYGSKSSAVLACSQCVSERLSLHGFKFTMERMASKRSRDILMGLPSKPKDLKNFIGGKMRRLGFGSFSSVSKKYVAPEEERALALFLGLAESGTKAQKEFVQAVKEISTGPNGKVNLISKENPHKLWKLFADNTSSEELQGLSKMLKEVSSEANAKGEVSKKSAFYRVLEKKAMENPELEDELELIKKKNCFFN